MQNLSTWMAQHRRAAPAQPTWLKRRPLGLLVGGALLLLALIVVVCVWVGSVAIPPDAALRVLLVGVAPAWSADVPAEYGAILWQIRLPRIALVAVAGAALAGAGTAYQGLFRNPLADPFLIGVASGAGLGALCVQALRTVVPGLPIFALPFGAFVGAILTVMLVYAIAHTGRHAGSGLVLAGVAVGSLASALSTLLLLRLSSGALGALAFLLGSYSQTNWLAVAIVAPPVAAGLALLLAQARALNLLLFDVDQARQLGVDVERVSLVVIVAATLVTAAAVSFCGLIGFVGMIVPHAARLVVGGDHRRLLPIAAIGGAGFLLVADLVARTAMPPTEIPVGIVTACVGAPFFLWLLRRS